MVDLEQDETVNLSSSESDELPHQRSKRAKSAECIASPKKVETQSYPASVSIDQLMKAGKFIKPVPKTKTVLNLESFDVVQKEWVAEKPVTVFIDQEKFASGAFRDAYKGMPEGGASLKKWVIKKYNEKARTTIVTTLSSTVEIHARKQVQMHSVARHLTKQFTLKVPKSFGKSFSYNKVFFAMYDGQPVTVEEFVPGAFTKYVNNDGHCIQPSEASESVEEIFQKAQALVHYTYVVSRQKLMLLDIQGSEYSLYDPEIATKDFSDIDDEVYFCCGNLLSISIDNFLDQHTCSTFCKMVIEK